MQDICMDNTYNEVIMEKTAANSLALSFLKLYLIIPLINFHKWLKFEVDKSSIL